MNSKFFSILTLKMSMAMTMVLWITAPKEKAMMVEWTMMKMLSSNFKLTTVVDKKTMAFASCVLIITSAVLIYSNYYMSESKAKAPFMKLIMAFIASMMVLIFSSNMISLVLGWEGLGMTSFILIMHYNNKKSLNSSFYTMIMNRMGDIMLLMMMIQMMSTNSWLMSATLYNEQNTMLMLAMTAAFSKSAQMPFSSWLTEAMAAPTPISALVHSSTLVTAGVFMFIRFEPILKYKKITTAIFTVSITTLIMASMNSTTEWDIKKVIALSTLSQISMMFITISMNLFNLAMFHLLVHATFKALIFLCSSTLISFSNTQDMRKMNKLSKNMFWTKMSFNIATMTLCGFPFMSSFYSKEMIMEMMLVKKTNSAFTAMFYTCMMCTLFYSLKSMWIINQSKHKTPMIPHQEQNEQKYSKLILLAPSVMYGNKMNWMMNMNFKIPHMTPTAKMIPIVMMIAMMITIKEMSSSNANKTLSTKKMKMMVNYMWFMKNLSIQMKKKMLTKFSTEFKNSEKLTFNKMIKSMKSCSTKLTSSNFTMTHNSPSKINMILAASLILVA